MNIRAVRWAWPVVMVLALAPDAAAQTVDSGVTAWMLTSTALVLLMVPGLAMFYAGLVRTKNVLGTMMHCFASMAIVGVLWVVCGYALAFGPNVLGGWFGWDSGLVMLWGIDDVIMEAGIPEYVFAMFQGKFAIITPALLAGALAERVKFSSYSVFIALWLLVVYCPVAHWVWAGDGFLFNMGANGAIDFAGGTVVHITAGVGALVAALFLGPRRGFGTMAMQPNNLTMTLIGAGLLWVGWFGFNAGSSVSSGLATAQALTVTQAAAASGALVWMTIEAVLHKKATSLGLASGILAGLVAITPAAGVVQVGGALILGAVAAILCFYAIRLKTRLGYDDTLDVFGIHGIAGITGAILLSFFIRPSWLADASALAGTAWTSIDQLGVQVTVVAITIVYAAVATGVLIFLVNAVMGFRLDDKDEMAGMDHSLHSERGYGMLDLN